MSDAKDKCEYVLLYVSSKVAKLIKVLPEFVSHDWDKLKDKLLYLYDADKDTTRYTISDLCSFTEDTATQSIWSLEQWKAYLHDFAKVADWLLQEKKISAHDHQKEFWRGLPRNFK